MTFWSSGPVHTALLVGVLVAVVSGPVGVLTVVRAQSFAGHSLSDIGAAGGAAAYLAGVPVLLGFVAANLAGAASMEAAGVQRARSRDVATGIVLGAALGLSALFLQLQTQSSTTGATVTVLFGSLFAFDPSTVPWVAALAAATLAATVVLYRPLLLASVHPELAAARGVAVRAVGAGYLTALALAVSLAAVTTGAVLSTALLIGPAAAALRLTGRPVRAMAAAAGIGAAATALGVWLSWESYYWPPVHRGWPVSFFIVVLVLAAYLATLGAPAARRGGR